MVLCSQVKTNKKRIICQNFDECSPICKIKPIPHGGHADTGKIVDPKSARSTTRGPCTLGPRAICPRENLVPARLVHVEVWSTRDWSTHDWSTHDWSTRTKHKPQNMAPSPENPSRPEPHTRPCKSLKKSAEWAWNGRGMGVECAWNENPWKMKN